MVRMHAMFEHWLGYKTTGHLIHGMARIQERSRDQTTLSQIRRDKDSVNDSFRKPGTFQIPIVTHR